LVIQSLPRTSCFFTSVDQSVLEYRKERIKVFASKPYTYYGDFDHCTFESSREGRSSILKNAEFMRSSKLKYIYWAACVKVWSALGTCI
ncbi:hypothetical protein MPER_02268, partial [Moniliophthora perniciosa FA553]